MKNFNTNILHNMILSFAVRDMYESWGDKLSTLEMNAKYQK